MKPRRLPVPVIVVGNVMVGGVGKTPVTMALVQHLTSQGFKVGVLSRGYGRDNPKDGLIRQVTANSTANEVGDEPLLIAKNCHVPVFVGADRAAAGLALLVAFPSVQLLICDDGLQHLALARDLELCVFDERGTGNGQLLPAGPLREPWPRSPGTQEIPCLVLKTSGRVGTQEYAVQRQLAYFAKQADGNPRPLQSWGNTPVQALAGIAKPEVFFSMLRAQGMTLSRSIALPDHANMDDFQINPSHGDLMCTEKDAVKLWKTTPHAWAVPLQTTLPQDLLSAIDLHIADAQRAKLSSSYGQ